MQGLSRLTIIWLPSHIHPKQGRALVEFFSRNKSLKYKRPSPYWKIKKKRVFGMIRLVVVLEKSKETHLTMSLSFFPPPFRIGPQSPASLWLGPIGTAFWSRYRASNFFLLADKVLFRLVSVYRHAVLQSNHLECSAGVWWLARRVSSVYLFIC